MQSFGRCVRHVNVTGTTRTRVLFETLPVASSSSVQWNSHRNASLGNPFNWIANKLNPTIKDEQPTKTDEQTKKKLAEKGQLGLFETVPGSIAPSKGDSLVSKPKFTEHKYSTANFKISHRKLNKLAQQIAGKPIDYAILQMKFSEKRASKRIKSMLAVAKDHAQNYKSLDPTKLVVAEAWVTKGPHFLKRLDIKGRGKHGIKIHPEAKMTVVLKEGKTVAELKKKAEEKKLKRIVAAGYVREDVPLRNMGPMWSW